MTSRSLFFIALWLTTTTVAATVRDETPAGPSLRAPTGKPKSSVPPADAASRGELLYQNHCTRCHTSVVHVREKRRADSLKALEGWVRRWSTEEQLGWSGTEIVEVVDFLNRRYYKFPTTQNEK